MIEKTFLNPATNKQWRIEIDGHTIRTCLNGGKVKEILCDSAFQVKSKAASASPHSPNRYLLPTSCAGVTGSVRA